MMAVEIGSQLVEATNTAIALLCVASAVLLAVTAAFCAAHKKGTG